MVSGQQRLNRRGQGLSMKLKSYQEVTVGNGEEQLDEGLESIVQGIVSIETEDSKVDITPTESSLQHGEADGNALELQCINLILWDLS